MAARGAFSPLLTPGLRSIFFGELKVTPMEHTAWLSTHSSQRAYEEEYKIAGLGRMMQKAEGTSYSFDEPISGSTLRYTHITYGLAFRVTEEMLEDDLYGVMNRMSKELAKAAQYNKDVQGTSILNNAFTSGYTGLNGVILCSTAQTSLGEAASQANRPTNHTDLDLPALQAAIESFETWVDDRNFEIQTLTPALLLHNAQDIWTAGEILKSEYVPNVGADNALNVVRTNYGIKPMHLKHLTDADAWFLVANKSQHDMKMFIRVDTKFKNSDDPLNGDAIFTARQRLVPGFGDWRGVYGSAGAP